MFFDIIIIIFPIPPHNESLFYITFSLNLTHHTTNLSCGTPSFLPIPFYLSPVILLLLLLLVLICFYPLKFRRILVYHPVKKEV